VRETKIVVDDFLEYLDTRFSKEVRFGIQRFFKIWSISEELVDVEESKGAKGVKLEGSVSAEP
jgi:hypothetical protein